MAQLFSGTIAKTDDEQRIVFGWAYVAKKATGDQVTDHSGDEVEPGNLEAVAYDYVLDSREGDEMHTAAVTATLVESVVFTPEKIEKLGLPADSVPLGWWVGFKVHSEEVWKRVKAGELAMFSIGGAGVREEIAE